LNGLLLGTAGFVLLTVALGLIRILRGPGDTERMMAAQLLGTGGVAVLLLLGVASGAEALIDVALVLALLAAFASIAFCKGAPGRPVDDAASASGRHAGDDL
jgi:multicomponent Na+:H+ antiporter subunit F